MIRLVTVTLLLCNLLTSSSAYRGRAGLDSATTFLDAATSSKVHSIPLKRRPKKQIVEHGGSELLSRAGSPLVKRPKQMENIGALYLMNVTVGELTCT